MNPQPPALSVIVPNYNHARFLPTCLRAILGQSLPPTEVIVIDDASTDNSLEVLEGFARRHPNLRVYRNEKNQGVVYNMNRGLELARGDYLFFAAADDEVHQGLFAKSLPLLAQYPNAGLSCTISEWVDIATGLKWHMAAGMAGHPCYLAPADMVRLGQRGRLFIVSASSIFRRAALIDAGRFYPELRWHCDWYATYFVGLRHGICYVPEALSIINIQPKSYYQSGHRKAEHLEVLRGILNRFTAPECRDVARRVRESDVLSVFSLPVLWLLLRHREYRQFLTPRLAAKTSRRAVELAAKRMLPVWITRALLQRFYPARTQAKDSP